MKLVNTFWNIGLNIGLAVAALISCACISASADEGSTSQGPQAIVLNAPETAGGGSLQPHASSPYFAFIDVTPGRDHDRRNVSGRVFNDTNADGRPDATEPGIPGVLVSNGLDVVRTDATGRYELAARGDRSVFVVQPRGWRTPTDENWIPQFSYQHKPAGSPKALRYGGLPPTGPIPDEINFPLRPADNGPSFQCLMIGDVQVYNNIELGYFRDSLVADVVRRPEQPDCAIFLGDVLGDDLGLMPRLQAVSGAMQVPQYYVHGNHDFDFDADSDADSADSWRRLYGPAYYAFEINEALFVVLDNVVYPCGEEDARLPGREFCLSPDRKNYNGRVDDTQMAWLANLLAQTPTDRTIVLLHHIPFVSFVDHMSTQHQTDNLADIHALIGDRKAFSFSGHTHTLEIMQKGDSFEGWKAAVDVGSVPFTHVIAGAAAGGWWSGDFDMDGVPMSISRLGEPRGYVVFGSGEGRLSLDFVPLGIDPARTMALSLSTPAYRNWFDEILAWRAEPQETRDRVPPYSINDLPDVKLLTLEDLAGGVFLTANIWQGTSTTEVSVSLNGGPAKAMTRTQEARGEAPRIGAEYSDPYAGMRQLSVSRTALESRSGNAAAQGYVGGRRVATGPRPPQPTGPVADRSSHLWRLHLPVDLAPGVYTAQVVANHHERVLTDAIIFEVVTERPQADWRADAWSAFENGPPAR
jgi:hypothetical protein